MTVYFMMVANAKGIGVAKLHLVGGVKGELIPCVGDYGADGSS